MATVNKDFRIKSGLIVEGANATVNGEDIITTGSNTDDLQEGTTNLYFTDERAVAAVGGSATDANTPNTVVKRDGNGNFAAGNITANQVTVQNAGQIFEDSGLILQSNSGYGISLLGNQNVEIVSSNGDILLSADGNVYKGSSAQVGNEVITQGRLDQFIGDNTVDGSTGNTVTDRIATAVSNLVNGAPELLDTLNELAAAINDDSSFASTIATQIGEKQNTLTAGTNISIVSDTISVTGLAASDISDFSTAALSATASAYDAAGAASSAETSANGYTDTAISGLSSVYEPLGAAATAVGALTTTDVEEGTNLYFTDTRAVDAITNATIYPTKVDINDYRREEATQTFFATASTANVHTFTAPHESAKYLVRVVSNTGGVKHSQLTEVLMTVDGMNNIAISEYGTIYTSENQIATFTAGTLGGNYYLTATTAVDNCEVIVAATLLSWAD